MAKTKSPGRNETKALTRRGKGVAKAAGRLALRLTGAAHFVDAFEQAENSFRNARRLEWAEAVVGPGEEGDDLAQRLGEALQSEDAELVRNAVLESARAAVDAVDSAVIPSIGLLTRKFHGNRTPDLRTYRTMLAMLRSLDADEFAMMRSGLHNLVGARKFSGQTSRTLNTAIAHGAGGNAGWQWIWYLHTAHVLAQGDLVHRVVRALQPLTEPDTGEAVSIGYGRQTHYTCVLATSLVELITELMPAPH